MRFDYDCYESLLIVDKRLSKDLFLQRAGASTGFATQLFSKLYDSIFAESEDLYTSYTKYYTEEYDNFFSYLQHEFSLNKAVFNEIRIILESNNNLRVIRWSQLSYGENSSMDLIFGEELGDRFAKILTGEGYED